MSVSLNFSFLRIMRISWITIVNLFVLHTGLYADDLELLRSEPTAYCPKEWYPLGDLCYKGFHDKLNFQEAEQKCVELGGHLAAITSLEVQLYVTVQVLLEFDHGAYGNPGGQYIGLRHNVSALKMHWTDGSDLNFQNWDANEPSKKAPGGEDEHCVQILILNDLNRVGKWNDIDCNRRHPYICQKAKSFEEEKPESNPVSCPWSPDGYYFRKSCYHFSPLRKSWEEAEKYCAEHYSGHLASVADVAVQTVLHYATMKRATSEDRMWIGIRLKPDEVALWTTGWYMGFTNWINESTNKRASFVSCGAMLKASGQWNNISCEESLSFICENSSAVPPARLNGTNDDFICPPEERDWIDLGGDYCYIFNMTAYVTWHHANFICMTKGGTLASVHSEAEERIFAQFTRYYKFGLHIGLFRHERSRADGDFEWADHSTVDYTNWRYGEPNDKEERCVELIPEGMKWNDKNCVTYQGFICSVRKVSRSAQKETKNGEKERNQDACECLPTGAVVGVVVCVLVIVVLVGVVLYNVKPWKKAKKDSRKRKSSLMTEKPRYRTGERIVSEQLYENVDRVY